MTREILYLLSGIMKYDELKLGEKTNPSILPLLAASIIFPVSVLFWVVNYFIQIVSLGDEDFDDGMYWIQFQVY